LESEKTPERRGARRLERAARNSAGEERIDSSDEIRRVQLVIIIVIGVRIGAGGVA
jgi:hypothetical protein